MKSASLKIFAFAGAFVSAVFLCVACVRNGDSTAAPKAENPPWRMIYNNDTTNILNCKSPFNEGRGRGLSPELTDEKIRASVREACVEGVDAQIISPAHCWVPWWRSEKWPLAAHEEWVREHYGIEPNLAEHRYLLAGGDIVRTFIDECHLNGRAALVSFRANDGHHLEQAFRSKPSAGVMHAISRFYVEHPEYRLAPVGNEKWNERVHNWEIPEARAFKEEMLAELIQNYPELDGVEIDFLRHPYFFKDETPLPRRIEIMSDFLKKARAQLDALQKADGRRRYLGVRVPQSRKKRGEGGWYDIGLDFAAWHGAGVDYFNLSPNYDMSQQSDMAQARKLAGGARLYAELTHTTGTWRMGGPGYDDHQYRRSTREALENTARLMRARGADGISFFNFAYYRQHGGMVKYKEPFNEPLFHALPRLADGSAADSATGYFFLNIVGAKEFGKGKAHEFFMDMLPAEGNGAATLRLLVLTEKERWHGGVLEPAEDIDRSEWEVSLNGTPLRRIENPFGAYPFPTEIGSGFNHAQQYVAYAVPAGLLKNGANAVRVRRTGEAPLFLRYIEIVQPPK